VRREDFNLVCDLLRTSLILIVGTNGRHYPKILADFLKSVAANKTIGKQLMENTIVNPRGIPGHGVAVDQYLEHQILLIKSFLKAGQSMGTVTNLTMMTPILEGIRETAKRELVMSNSSSHSKPNRAEDIEKAVTNIANKLLADDPPENWKDPYAVAGIKLNSKAGGQLTEEWGVEEEEVNVGEVNSHDELGD